jgi:hypothetical protein
MISEGWAMVLSSHYTLMIWIFIGFLALLGAILFLFGARSLRRHRLMAGSLQGLTGLLLLEAAGLCVAVLLNLHTYSRLTYETPVAEVRFQERSNQHFWAYVTLGRAEAMIFDIRGDEWQLDARVLKWKGTALLLGSDTLYRLDRLSGRYRDISQERKQPRSVYSFVGEGVGLDIWSLIQRYSRWVPWVDAVYGNAAYVPMADGARFIVSIGASGLVARPGNSDAEKAVRNWP